MICTDGYGTGNILKTITLRYSLGGGKLPSLKREMMDGMAHTTAWTLVTSTRQPRHGAGFMRMPFGLILKAVEAVLS